MPPRRSSYVGCARAAGWLVGGGAVAAGMLLAMLARPERYEVDGVSMAPGLMPGDIVATGPFPILAARRGPRRFDRWVLTAADGTPAIKRVTGLPGERIAIHEGDLVVDGRRIVAPPPILAETASAVEGFGLDDADGGRACRHVASPGVVLDDASFAPQERRLLLPVRDIGLTAVVQVHQRRPLPPLKARVGGIVIGWRPPAAGRFAVVAGRLDGHLVAACWRSDAAAPPAPRRCCLPAGSPSAWQVERPWPTAGARGEEPADDTTAAIELAVWVGGDPSARGEDPGDGCDPSAGEIESFVVWRDVLHRPAADGRDTWQLGPDEVFVLGDFPSGSRDSRHWGPLSRAALVAPVSSAR